eukprot:Seg1227.9 transcript_id=Seg1227.9/GoldUCD/mRNA.D3Y31 product="putative cation-transporting ATPase 13A3" protein_id=Seg1227.9/GoldUCD/D3Y31
MEANSKRRKRSLEKEILVNPTGRCWTGSNKSTGCIQEGEDNVTIFNGVKRNLGKTVLFYILGFLTAGFLFLVAYWKPKWRSSLMHSVCSLEMATSILLEDQYGQVEIVDVERKPVNGDHEMRNVLNVGDHDFYDDFTLTGSNDDMMSIENEEKDPLVNSLHCGAQVLQARFFEYKHQRYFWHEQKHNFYLLTGFEDSVHFRDVYQNAIGISRKQENDKLIIYGENTIDVCVKSYGKLFIEEAADPFYIFQLFSCIMWFFDDYYYYSATILMISLISIFISIYQTRQHLVSLRNMIAKSEQVTVLRPDGREEVISSKNLVPGDIMVIPANGCELHCDAVLLSGTAIVNESMLTGESIPVTKTPLPNPPSNKPELNEVIDTLKHKRHTLFCGTKVLQTRFYDKGKVLSYVLRTGYYTTKGNLIRSILFPKPVGYRFFSDALKFVAVLGIFASAGFVYTIYVFKQHGAGVGEIMLRALDVITIAVPPALPAAMTVGTIYALQRLKKVKIYCTSPSRINISGKIKLFCFDKTGTLTEDGLDYYGTILVNSGHFREPMKEILYLNENEGVQCMATCQSLTVIDGNLIGDPLDLKMFEATGWDFEESLSLAETERFGSLIPTVVRSRNEMKHQESEDKFTEIAILKQFTFSSELQRMSVIARKLGDSSMHVYVKGSPEIIASLCVPKTLPKNFDDILRSYTEEGFRVIALASRSLPKNMKWHHVQHLIRNDVEKELNFQGFLILKNMVKKETKPTIDHLYSSNIRVVMITGDNMLTAISVAKECNMVHAADKLIHVSATLQDCSSNLEISYSFISDRNDRHTVPYASCNPPSLFDFRTRGYHFAMNGKTFFLIRSHMPTLYQRLLVCGTVFARMMPDQKSQLVEDLQSIGYTVGMCGDGANDCGALKVAHAGVSLSEAEASIASPFTAQIPNISCVLEIVKEGRCALVTSFSLFKYMALYSMVQYMSVLLLYSVRSNLGDFQYLYIDLFIIMPFAITMSRTGAYHKIISRRPLGSLVHPLVLTSLICQILTQLAFQLFVFFFVKTRSYYKTTDWFFAHTKHKKGETQILSHDNTVLFYVSSFQYIFLAVVFSIGKSYRGKIYKNVSFVAAFFILTGFTLLLVFYPAGALHKIFQLVIIDDPNFLLTLLLLAGCNAVVSFVIEVFIVRSEFVRHMLNWLRRKKRKKNKYKHIMIDMSLDESWPPVPER